VKNKKFELKSRFGLIIFSLVFLFIPQANADWINLTGSETAANIAEIYVNDDHVKVVLEVYVGDLEVFNDLVPDEWMKNQSDKRPDQKTREAHFSKNVLQIITDKNKNLTANFRLIEPRMRVDRQSPFAGMINPYTRQRVPDAPGDKRVLYAEIIYPFKEKPKSLSFIPPTGKEGSALVTIGFITYHKSVPVIDFRYLGSAAILSLDWNDPWYSKFKNPNLKRHHKSALMSFLYVEPHEVRHEILTRVKDLETWMELGLRGKDYIEVDELEGLKQRVGEFLLQKNPVLIDGKTLKPILDRTNYVKVGIKGIQLLQQPERLEISTAIVGVIIAYIPDSMPQEVKVDWELFTDQINRVPATATDPAGPLPTYLTPDDNVHIWTNYLKNYVPPTVAHVELSNTVNKMEIPWASILTMFILVFLAYLIFKHQKYQLPLRPLIIATSMFAIIAVVLYPFARITVDRPVSLVQSLNEEESSRVLNSLLKNVYRAFDFRQESDVYDKLALSVEGDLLSEIYLQNRKSFAVKKAGGAQARVKEVEVISVDAIPDNEKEHSFILNAKWTAMGTVGHWGHVHTRKNYYDAAITVEVIDGNWKITKLELLEEKRLDPLKGPLKDPIKDPYKKPESKKEKKAG